MAEEMIQGSEISEQNEPVAEPESVVAEGIAPSDEPLPVAPELPEKNEPEAEHSPKFEKVYGFYKSGTWNENQVRNAVKKDWITAAEFTEITGKEY